MKYTIYEWAYFEKCIISVWVTRRDEVNHSAEMYVDTEDFVNKFENLA